MEKELATQNNIYSLGLMDYKTRFYDPRIIQFQQPDTLTPEPYNPKYLNRYAYTLGNPINATDPSGHCTKKSYSKTIITDDECEERPQSDVSISNHLFGSVVVGQSYPVDSLSTLSNTAQDTYNGYSTSGDNYQTPTRFSLMSGGDAGMYAFNWAGVLVDQLAMWTPHRSPNNVFILADWEYQEDTYTIPRLHLINYTMSSAKILQVWVEPSQNPYYGKTLYKSSEWVGRNGDNPGVLDYSLSSTQYPRNGGTFLSIWVKVASFALPIKSKILIPGNGLQPGLSDPIPWITHP